MDSTTIIAILIPAAIVGVVVLSILYNRRKKKREQTENSVLEVFSDRVEHSPKGITFASRSGANPQAMTTADEALTELFADARAIGYTEWLDHSYYTIYLLDNCTPSPEQQIPSFKLRADNYDGTIYDQDPTPGVGHIFASEFVITDGVVQHPTGEYVICSDLAWVAQNVRNGAEHILQHKNRHVAGHENDYERDKTHGAGNPHPLIPRQAQRYGFSPSAKASRAYFVKRDKVRGLV